MNLIIIFFILIILCYRNKKLTNLDILARSIVFLLIVMTNINLSKYNKNKIKERENFSDNPCYPGHIPMDAKDSIDSPLKYWCEFSGDLPKDDDTEFRTKEPTYIKDVTKNTKNDLSNAWINYISRGGINELSHPEKSHNHVLEMRNFGREKQDKKDESRKLKPIQPSESSEYLDIVGINTENLEYFIIQKSFVDSRKTAKKYRLKDVKIDIIKPKTKKPCPFVLFLHGMSDSTSSIEKNYNNIYANHKDVINKLVKNKIACVIIKYKTDMLVESYYQIKYVIQHLKFFSIAYNIDYAKMAIYGISLGAQMAYIFSQYSPEILKKLEKLMDMDNTPFLIDTNARLLILDKPQLFMDCRRFTEYLFIEDGKYYTNDTLNGQLGHECNNKLSSWYNIDYEEIDSGCNKKLLRQTHLIDYFNDNKSNVPIYVINDINLDKKPYKLSSYENKNIILHSPIFSKKILEKAKKHKILSEGNIPSMNISSCMDFGEFIIKYL